MVYKGLATFAMTYKELAYKQSCQPGLNDNFTKEDKKLQLGNDGARVFDIVNKLEVQLPDVVFLPGQDCNAYTLEEFEGHTKHGVIGVPTLTSV
jgi:hypothetical protein